MSANSHFPSSEQLEYLARRFREHGRNIYGSSSPENASPLYAELCMDVARDAELRALVAQADQSTTITNLFFGAVHFLLLGGIQHPLADFYPDLTSKPRPKEEAFPALRTFCLEHAGEIRALVTTRYVQTNEVGRCAALLPAFCLLGQRLNGQPLALVEIGASAGLHLLWDRYGYDYGSGRRAGDASSPVQLRSTLRGEHQLPLPATLPVVAYRVGLDIHPIDVHDEGATRWLRALIWPEHRDRRQSLDAALTVARQAPPPLLAGNAAETLPTVLEDVPADAVLCIYHSYTLNQMPASLRESILAHIAIFAHKRPLYRISQEWYAGQNQPHLELFSYEKAEIRQELLAYCESHGRWVEWLRT